MSTLRQQLIDEYNQHAAIFDRAPNPWNVCNAREEAGYHLKRPRPWESYRRHVPVDLDNPFWKEVGDLIEQAIGSMDPIQAFAGGEVA